MALGLEQMVNVRQEEEPGFSSRKGVTYKERMPGNPEASGRTGGYWVVASKKKKSRDMGQEAFAFKDLSEKPKEGWEQWE